MWEDTRFFKVQKKRHWVLTNTLCLNNVISSKFTLIACLSRMHYKSHMHYKCPNVLCLNNVISMARQTHFNKLNIVSH